MKRFQLFIIFSVLLFTLIITSGCYTSFQTVRYHRASVGDDYLAEETVYVEEEEPVEVNTVLEYRPSRLVIQKTYFDYGGYVRKVRYVAYDPWDEPFVDAFYYDDPDIYVNIYIGSVYPHVYYHWYNPFFYAGYYVAWMPPVGWYDPWWCGPVYYPVPIYYPAPIIIYDPPYYGGGYVRPPVHYGKRDWDRRQITDRRRIVRGGSRSGENPGRRELADARRINQRDITRRTIKSPARPARRITQDAHKLPEKKRSIRRDDRARRIERESSFTEVRQPREGRSSRRETDYRGVKNRSSGIHTVKQSGILTTQQRPQADRARSEKQRIASNNDRFFSHSSRDERSRIGAGNDRRKAGTKESALSRPTRKYEKSGTTRQTGKPYQQSYTGSHSDKVKRSYRNSGKTINRPAEKKKSYQTTVRKNSRKESRLSRSTRTYSGNKSVVKNNSTRKSYSKAEKPKSKTSGKTSRSSKRGIRR